MLKLRFTFKQYGKTELNFQAFTNATIHLNPTTVLTDATLLEQNGRIVAVGQNLTLLKTPGYTINLELIFTHHLLNSTANCQNGKKIAIGAKRSLGYRDGYYWNDHIISDYNSLADYSYDKTKAKSMRNAGFGVVNTHRANGIHRGTSLLLALSDQLLDRERFINTEAVEHFSFKRVLLQINLIPALLWAPWL